MTINNIKIMKKFPSKLNHWILNLKDTSYLFLFSLMVMFLTKYVYFGIFMFLMWVLFPLWSYTIELSIFKMENNENDKK